MNFYVTENKKNDLFNIMLIKRRTNKPDFCLLTGKIIDIYTFKHNYIEC